MVSLGKCNCGREVRYNHFKEGEQVGSCNKYQVCPTYEELENQLKSLQSKYRELKQSAIGVTLYREGSDLYKDAENVIRKHEEYFI